MTHMGRTLIAALSLAFATVAMTGAQAAPGKEKRRHQQVMPTGAEDAPARAAKAVAADPGEAVIEHSTRKDTVGLYEEVLPDGSISVDLDDRFHQVARLVQNDDGTTQVVCGDKPLTPKKAAAKAKGKPAKKAPKAAALEEK